MSNKLKITFILLSFCLFLSCQEQEKREQLKVITKQTKPQEKPKDPYFTKSDAIYSPFGPNTITRNIIQDKNGIFWLATWEGIIQYNGHNFINFTNKHKLKPARVFTILEDKTGKIWFGTVGMGIFLYDGKDFKHITTKDGLINDTIGCFMEDKAGNIWIGTQNGISKYDGKAFTNFNRKKGTIEDDINSIVEDKMGKLWIGTRGTACIYDGIKFTTIKNETGFPFVNVRTIIKDSKDNIWLGGSDGLWSNNGLMWNKITGNFVGYIYEDTKGNIWTSSEGSTNNNWVISRYNEEWTPTQIKAADNMFFGIIEDSAGNIWWGSLRGIFRYSGKSIEGFREVTEMEFKID
jgi:ligand-binding sensor domain-containing protein